MKKIALLVSISLFCGLSINSFAYEDAQTWEGESGEPYVYIDGLEKDLFQMYFISDSRGPNWGKDVEYISRLVDRDFSERVSYWSESGYPTNECPHFTDEDFENTVEEVYYDIKWESVKRRSGSTRTLFYLASFEIILNANGSGKSCTYIQKDYEKFVFLNQLDEDGNPEFLGYLSKFPEQN